MPNTATISPLSIVQDHPSAPVKPLLSEEEKQFLNLIAQIFVQDLLKTHQTNKEDG